MKVMLGHDGPPTSFWRENLLTGEPLHECPLRTWLRAFEDQPALAQELVRYTGTYFPAYEDGHLLEAGGLADQPARYLDGMIAIRDTKRAVQARYDELKTPDAHDGEDMA
jgi:hypothetical protein